MGVMHCRRTRALVNTVLWCALVATASLYALNKSGVGTSIHSFVVSSVLKVSYVAVASLVYGCVAFLTPAAALTVASCLALYLTFLSAAALKPLCLLAVLSFWPRNK